MANFFRERAFIALLVSSFCKELTYAKLSKTPTKELKEFPSSTSDCIHFVAGKPDCKRKPYASQAIGTADGATKTIVST
ncbi:unnamed protein product [Clavelina lepadiformis]|uniref:Secreted protein n=1 Tax=Clavelina lepadiformis TaxID=159417 RepID=A0ABP0GXX5_CLALP